MMDYKTKMKKILVYVTPEEYASLFDVIVGYDEGADAVVRYSKVDAKSVPEIVHNCVFTRRTDDLKNTAIFIGGKNVDESENLMLAVTETLGTLPDVFRVSVAIDPEGTYTTASACVAKIKKTLGSLNELNAVVLAGTGPVGRTTAVLLSHEGCSVGLTSRSKANAAEVCKTIKRVHDIDVTPYEAWNDESMSKAVSVADIIVSSGSEGIKLLSQDVWASEGRIKLLADLNAVPPTGIEGIEVTDDNAKRNGKICFGAMPIGNLKMKCHRLIVQELFKDNNREIGLTEVYNLCSKLV